MRYLVDTDWAINYLNRVESVVRRINELSPDGLGISMITLAELYEGVFYSRNPEDDARDLRRFLDSVSVVELDDEICRIFAMERGRLRAAGNTIGDLDTLIAATAIRHNLTLLTNNRRHFERIQGLNVVSI